MAQKKNKRDPPISLILFFTNKKTSLHCKLCYTCNCFSIRLSKCNTDPGKSKWGKTRNFSEELTGVPRMHEYVLWVFFAA